MDEAAFPAPGPLASVDACLKACAPCAGSSLFYRLYAGPHIPFYRTVYIVSIPVQDRIRNGARWRVQGIRQRPSGV